MPRRADGYQATSGFSNDSTLYDSNTSTGYERTLPGVAQVAEITVKLDLHASPTAVKKIRATFKYNSSITVKVENSSDDSSYSEPANSGPPLLGNSCSYNSTTGSWTITTAASVRYWRISFRNTDSDGCGTSNLGIFEIEALDASDVHITDYEIAPQTVSLTPLDLTPSFPSVVAGTPQTVNLAPLDLAPFFPVLSAKNSQTVNLVPLDLKLSFPLVYTSDGTNQVVGLQPLDLRVGFTAVVVGQSNADLFFDQCRDLAGALWTDPVSVATGVDHTSAGGVWWGDGYGALYTKNQAAGATTGNVYWKSTSNPDDWSGASEVDTGADGAKVWGLARNSAGVICGIVDDKPLISRDLGQTWTLGSAIAGLGTGSLHTIIAYEEWFVVVKISGNSPQHFVSQDGGSTWL